MIKKILPYLIAAALIFGAFKLLTTPPKGVDSGASDQEAQIFLFWGEGCPHCEVVKDYIISNNLDSKLKISQKEVYSNLQNLELLKQKASNCPEYAGQENFGVPFAYFVEENKCHVGDTPIINAMEDKLNPTSEASSPESTPSSETEEN